MSILENKEQSVSEAEWAHVKLREFIVKHTAKCGNDYLAKWARQQIAALVEVRMDHLPWQICIDADRTRWLMSLFSIVRPHDLCERVRQAIDQALAEARVGYSGVPVSLYVDVVHTDPARDPEICLPAQHLVYSST